jgi:hypothetical protein
VTVNTHVDPGNTVASIAVPPGKYHVIANVNVQLDQTAPDGESTCSINANDAVNVAISYATLSAAQYPIKSLGTHSMQLAWNASQATTFTVGCWFPFTSSTGQAFSSKLSAVAVGAIHLQ